MKRTCNVLGVTRACVAALGLVQVLGACASAGSVRIETAKSAGYTKQLERTIVFVQSGRVPVPIDEALKDRLPAALGARGVNARVGRLPDKLGLESPLSMAEQAKAFQASTLFLLATDGGVETRQGRLVTQQYDGRVLDVATQKLIWRAEVHWTPGDSVEGSADALVEKILAAFEADGLIARGRDR